MSDAKRRRELNARVLLFRSTVAPFLDHNVFVSVRVARQTATWLPVADCHPDLTDRDLKGRRRGKTFAACLFASGGFAVNSSASVVRSEEPSRHFPKTRGRLLPVCSAREFGVVIASRAHRDEQTKS
jgi:hypothetical protein